MLRLERVCVSYGHAVALREVSLSVGEGELVCIVGPNGAGKSTLINAIAGLNRVRAGSMQFDGVELTRLPAHRYCATGIALVPEARRLFGGMSVRENLEMGSLSRQARRTRRASMERVCALFPALRANLSRAAGLLSGGQQQMVAIGRALMARPRLLLLDEPSLGLAPVIVQELFAAVAHINGEGTAVLLVEQNVAHALAMASRAYVLEEGAIAAEDSSAALLARPELRRAYLGIGGVAGI
jgi:branched-chain amino acid transport system ATP-binding protein